MGNGQHGKKATRHVGICTCICIEITGSRETFVAYVPTVHVYSPTSYWFLVSDNKSKIVSTIALDPETLCDVGALLRRSGEHQPA
jgi:hypothetical protein